MLSANRTFPHAMLREIFEQPGAIAQTLAAYTDGNSLREDTFLTARQALVGKDSLLVSAIGSSRGREWARRPASRGTPPTGSLSP